MSPRPLISHPPPTKDHVVLDEQSGRQRGRLELPIVQGHVVHVVLMFALTRFSRVCETPSCTRGAILLALHRNGEGFRLDWADTPCALQQTGVESRCDLGTLHNLELELLK